MKILLGLTLSLLAATVGITVQAAPQTQAVPRDRPTYNEVYEFCLASYAGTGIGRDVGLIGVVLKCRGQAELSSGGPKPTPSDWSAQYEQCLLGFAVNGAPRGGDVGIYCSELATGVSGQQPPEKRYVVLQQAPNPQAPPSYAETYELCLVMLAETGFGRQIGIEKIVLSCNQTAAEQSGTPKPQLTPYAEIYERCLLDYAMFGAPKGLDLGKACTEVATGVTSTAPPETTRRPR